MHVFLTGASGWVGRGLVPDLIAAGHTVTGLARSEAAAVTLRAAGAEVRAGSLDDLDILRDAAAAADGVIHLAFKHDIAFAGDFAGATDADRAAIGTFGEALAGTDKPFVIASGILGVLGLPPGVVATENDGRAAQDADREVPISGANGRIDNANYTLALAARGVRSSVVRLPPATHGDGDNGFIPTAIDFARQKGAAAYVGDGTNRWPAVHRDDAARLFRLALEAAPPGSALHAVGDEGVPLREVAEVLAAHLDLPAVSVTPDQIGDYVGFLGGFWGFDGPASAQITRDLLGWQPTRPGLIADLKEGHYFA
ncbi:nucleoside-diphosphate-sugar epimerase [Frankia torreyi]|uniref:Nucleoside-diphosphate-sugar epimerase n=1 Tax=Frankia torreyi TaxID=1856 RepID=A0A0D8B5R0_9ACTN|nr:MULTISPECIES: SDR family oxidoreductase [Frankia]KJE19526.1 nucleoside-diphosphate-sugar epimerase [Frankia torreyi]KQM01965.1 nucleoside-diphosphate-sugar epimerase [Frankia sp. CpI1-P]